MGFTVNKPHLGQAPITRNFSEVSNLGFLKRPIRSPDLLTPPAFSPPTSPHEPSFLKSDITSYRSASKAKQLPKVHYKKSRSFFNKAHLTLSDRRKMLMASHIMPPHQEVNKLDMLELRRLITSTQVNLPNLEKIKQNHVPNRSNSDIMLAELSRLHSPSRQEGSVLSSPEERAKDMVFDMVLKAKDMKKAIEVVEDQAPLPKFDQGKYLCRSQLLEPTAVRGDKAEKLKLIKMTTEDGSGKTVERTPGRHTDQHSEQTVAKQTPKVPSRFSNTMRSKKYAPSPTKRERDAENDSEFKSESYFTESESVDARASGGDGEQKGAQLTLPSMSGMEPLRSFCFIPGFTKSGNIQQSSHDVFYSAAQLREARDKVKRDQKRQKYLFPTNPSQLIKQLDDSIKSQTDQHFQIKKKKYRLLTDEESEEAETKTVNHLVTQENEELRRSSIASSLNGKFHSD